MKLLSLNVALFEPNNSKLTKFLKDQAPDIVCFQEVTRALDTNVLKKYISKDPIDTATSKLSYGFYGPVDMFGSFELKEFHGKGKFRFNPGGILELGNYMKSKYPIKKAQNIFLEGHFTYDTDWNSKWPEEDYRAALVADIYLGKNLLRVINYHGIWTRDKLGNERTLSACKKIKDLALEAKGEVIICGDFNLFPGTPSMKVFQDSFISLVERYNIKMTRPASNELSGQDRNVVDYILLSRNIKVKSFNVLGTDVSDHLPLVLEFELPK